MPNRAFNHILNAVHLHSTMSMSISPMKRASSTATFQTTPSSSPILKEHWGHWMATSMHDPHLRIIHITTCKGLLTQNVLAATTFNMHFCYILSWWEGSASDDGVYHDAQVHDLSIPEGKYYLADAGYPLCDALLVPFQGVHYHLREWRNLAYGEDSLGFTLELQHTDYTTVLQHTRNLS